MITSKEHDKKLNLLIFNENGQKCNCCTRIKNKLNKSHKNVKILNNIVYYATFDINSQNLGQSEKFVENAHRSGYVKYRQKMQFWIKHINPAKSDKIYTSVRNMMNSWKISIIILQNQCEVREIYELANFCQNCKEMQSLPKHNMNIKNNQQYCICTRYGPLCDIYERF